jgi:hypothetical protein
MSLVRSTPPRHLYSLASKVRGWWGLPRRLCELDYITARGSLEAMVQLDPRTSQMEGFRKSRDVSSAGVCASAALKF